MAIEIFLIEEAEQLISNPEATDEWHKKVDELGLEGQQTLAKPEKSPIPFLRLKEGEMRVYKTLCPNHTAVKRYANSTIPLRVLSLIALSEKEQYFKEIEIWDDLSKPDPVAIGFPENNWNDGYIIARWGDELRSFTELQQMAVKRYKEEKMDMLKSKIAEIDNLAKSYFKGNWVDL